MGSSTLNIAIENKFKTAWGTTTPVSYDGTRFIVPTVNWVHIEVWDGSSRKASLGTGVQLRRSSGTIFITIYTELGEGSKPARELADAACEVFRDFQVSGLTCYEPEVKRLGEVYHASSTSGAKATLQWYQMIVSVPFIYNQYI